MKEVYSRNGGTSMKNKHNISKYYNIELLRGVSSIQTLLDTIVSSFLVKGVEDNGR